MIAIDLRGGELAPAWRADPCSVLFELAARYPGEPVALNFSRESILLFQDAQAARHVARSRAENYQKNFGAFVKFFGQSRLTADGERWSRLQKMSQPAVVATDPQDVANAAITYFGQAIDAMLAEALEGPVRVDPHLDRAAASVVAQVTLGFGPDDISSSLIEDFRTILHYASMTTWEALNPQSAEHALRPGAVAARERLQQGIDGLLSRRDDGAARQLLRAIIDAGEDVDAVGEICSLMFAGSDTTGAALGWAMWLLAAAPQLRELLAGEVADVLQGSGPVVDKLSRLDQVIRFQNESLRIFPPVPILSRAAVDADEICGHPIAAGQKVLLSIIGLHHDGAVFPSSRRVSLNRFADGSAGQLRGHFLPFGDGPRVCGGSRIANIELTTALSVIVSRMALRRHDAGALAFDWVGSLRRRGGQVLGLEALH